MRTLISILYIIGVIGFATASIANQSDSPNPKVLKTIPSTETTTVDPKIAQIRVTFDQDMMNSYSWCKVPGKAFPKTTGQPWFEKDKRTCVLPVALEPGKTYALTVNGSNSSNFRSLKGQAADIYYLEFETAE